MAPLSPSRIRAINLIETLKEERRERRGLDREEEKEEEAPEEAVEWPEERIRAWFSERGDEKEKKGEEKGSAGGAGRDSPSAPPPRVDPAALRALWFPSAARPEPSRPSSPSSSPSSSSSSSPCPPPPRCPLPPSCVLVAFACAGSAEDLWSSEGTGPRRAPSPLLRWLAARGGRLLSAQLPGRGARRREPFAESARAVAREVVSLVAAEILVAVPPPETGGDGDDGEGGKKSGGAPAPPPSRVPWFVAGHSMGAWLAFELASAARDAGLHPPTRLLLSAMPPPHTPEARRPWRGPAALLPTPDLVAECRAWGISEAVFSPGVWEEYEPLLRNDFRLFDEYRFERGADPPFSCPLTFFFGDRDARVPEGGARGWERYCEGGREKVEGEEEEGADEEAPAAAAAVVVVKQAGNFELVRVRGGRHLWPLDKLHKARWLFEIARRMASDLGLPGPEEEGGE